MYKADATQGPARRKRAPRFIEIARAAQVSPTTVDRVLNERGSVSEALRRRVIEAARRLGVRRVLPDPGHGLLRFDLVLARSGTHYFRQLQQSFAEAARILDARIVMQRSFWDERDDERLAGFLARPALPRHGLIVVAHDDERIRAELARVIDSGVPVVTLMSDIGGIARHAYAGIDNYAAGRTAGYLLGRCCPQPGRALVLTNSLRFRAHLERVGGCRDALAARAPWLRMEPAIETWDEPGLAARRVREALARWPDVAAIYDTGAASAGIEAALRELRPGPAPVWIAHEASAEHRALLREGRLALVIDQDPQAQALASLQHLLRATGLREGGPVEAFTPFRLVTPENLAGC